MRTRNLNEQILSEKEMKEVKGGWTTTLDGDFRFCPKCGHPVYPINIGNSYTAYCNGCGSPLEDTTTSNTNKES